MSDVIEGTASEISPNGVATEESSERDLTTYPGVLVVRVPQENGDQQIQVVEVNGHDPLASPTLLEASVKVKRSQLNL